MARVNVYCVSYVVESEIRREVEGADDEVRRVVGDPQTVKIIASSESEAQELAWKNALAQDDAAVSVRSVGGPALITADVLLIDGSVAPAPVPAVEAAPDPPANKKKSKAAAAAADVAAPVAETPAPPSEAEKAAEQKASDQA